MRDYVPLDDGQEPADFDEYFDVPAQTDKDLACRFCIKVVRDPRAAAVIRQQQNEVILEALQWARAHRKQQAEEGHLPG